MSTGDRVWWIAHVEMLIIPRGLFRVIVVDSIKDRMDLCETAGHPAFHRPLTAGLILL